MVAQFAPGIADDRFADLLQVVVLEDHRHAGGKQHPQKHPDPPEARQRERAVAEELRDEPRNQKGEPRANEGHEGCDDEKPLVLGEPEQVARPHGRGRRRLHHPVGFDEARACGFAGSRRNVGVAARPNLQALCVVRYFDVLADRNPADLDPRVPAERLEGEARAPRDRPSAILGRPRHGDRAQEASLLASGPLAHSAYGGPVRAGRLHVRHGVFRGPLADDALDAFGFRLGQPGRSENGPASAHPIAPVGLRGLFGEELDRHAATPSSLIWARKALTSASAVFGSTS